MCPKLTRFISHKEALHHLQMSNASLPFVWPGETLHHLQMSNAGLPFVWPGETLHHLQMSNASLPFVWPGETLHHLQMSNADLPFGQVKHCLIYRCLTLVYRLSGQVKRREEAIKRLKLEQVNLQETNSRYEEKVRVGSSQWSPLVP